MITQSFKLGTRVHRLARGEGPNRPQAVQPEEIEHAPGAGAGTSWPGRLLPADCWQSGWSMWRGRCSRQLTLERGGREERPLLLAAVGTRCVLIPAQVLHHETEVVSEPCQVEPVRPAGLVGVGTHN